MARNEEARRSVLAALEEVAVARVESTTYHGDTLKQIVRAVEVVGTSELRPGQERCIIDASRILGRIAARIIGRLQAVRRLSPTSDAVWVDADLRRLASTAGALARFVVLQLLRAPTASLELAANQVLDELHGAQSLFSLGLDVALAATISGHRFALHLGLRIRETQHSESHRRSEAALIGYAAILRAGGPTFRQWVRDQLEPLAAGDLLGLLRRAEEALRQGPHIAAADAVQRWRSELEGEELWKPRRAASSCVSVHLSPIQVVVARPDRRA